MAMGFDFGKFKQVQGQKCSAWENLKKTSVVSNSRTFVLVLYLCFLERKVISLRSYNFLCRIFLGVKIIGSIKSMIEKVWSPYFFSVYKKNEGK